MSLPWPHADSKSSVVWQPVLIRNGQLNPFRTRGDCHYRTDRVLQPGPWCVVYCTPVVSRSGCSRHVRATSLPKPISRLGSRPTSLLTRYPAPTTSSAHGVITLVSFSDKTLTCRDCGQPFVWTASEQEFYQSRGFENEPVRCRECRNRRKMERGTSMTSGGSSSASASYAGGRSASRGTREMFPAVCDECGKQTQVPFQPTSGKPVYCSDCFERRRSYR